MIRENPESTIPGTVNRAIHTIVSTLGIIFGIGGIAHGFFETLQGNTATNGFFIEAIGEADRMWLHGNEPAFTIIPNFLITGIAAISVGVIVVIWSAGFMHKKHASSIFLALFILLFLVGGGVAQVIFFTVGWAMSTQIRKTLRWWRRVLPAGMRRFVSKLWRPFLIVGSVSVFFRTASSNIWVCSRHIRSGRHQPGHGFCREPRTAVFHSCVRIRMRL